VKEPFLERHHVATFLVLVGLGVGLATASVNSPYRVTRLQRIGLALTSPLARAGSGIAGLLGDAWAGLGSLGGIHEELEATRTENRDLRVRLDGLREAEKESARLRGLLRLENELEYLAVPARIIHRQAAPDRVLMIDRGTADGLRVDLAVIAPGGVVGKVLAVDRRSAKVQCVSDPEAGAAVLVGEGRRQADAIVRDIVGDGLLRLRHLELLADVRAGDAVVTSGLDQIYPKGWLLGTVEEVVEQKGFEPEVHVRPAVDLGTLEEVLVLLPKQPRRALEAEAADEETRP